MSVVSHDAFSQIFGQSVEALRRYVTRLVGSRETAEDIAQEAFLRTHCHAATIRNPRAFLFSTARNLAANHRRHEFLAKTDLVGDFAASSVESVSESLETEVLAEEEMRLLCDAVASLPPKCRAVFVLRIFHSYSYRKIGTELGISVKTVENHFAKGLRETQQRIRRRCEEPYRMVNLSHG